jgi:hypothetical protein
MPLPSLPLELVTLIVLELRLSCDDDTARRANGLAVALVCKSWVLIGEQVVWHRVVLDSAAQATFLLKHFEEHKHLPKLVKDLKVGKPTVKPASDDEASDDEALDDDEDPASTCADLASLWTCCTSITELEYDETTWMTTGSFLKGLRNLKALRNLAFLFSTMEAEEPLVFLDTLNFLTNLEELTVISMSEVPRCRWVRAPSQPPLSLWQLKYVVSPSGGGQQFINHLLDLIKPETLLSCVSYVDPLYLDLVDRFLLFPNLYHLSIGFRRDLDVSPLLQHLLEACSRSNRSFELTVAPLGASQDQIPSSPISLSNGATINDLLALVPADTSLELEFLHVEDAELPLPTQEMLSWDRDTLEERISSFVRCDVACGAGEEARVERKAFAGMKDEKGLIWGPLEGM